MRSVSCDRPDVQPILQVAEDVLVDVDYGDLVRFFAGQVKCRGPADLTGPQNQDSHSGSGLTYCAMSHFVP